MTCKCDWGKIEFYIDIEGEIVFCSTGLGVNGKHSQLMLDKFKEVAKTVGVKPYYALANGEKYPRGGDLNG